MNKKAFTLIELLVVVAVLALLASIVFSNLGGAREGARISNALSFQSQIHSLLGSDLVGWWNFNEESGTTARDISGYDNHGTIVGATYVDGVPGTGGSALEFDGVGDYVEISNPLINDGLFTITSWFKLNASKPEATLLEGIGRGMHLAWPSNQRMLFYYGSELYVYSKNNNHFDEKWHHVAFVIEYDNNNPLDSSLQIFIDGIDETNYRSFSTDRFGIFKDNLRISYPESVGGYINGLIDDVRIYSRALTAQEIQTLYVQTKDKYLAENE